MALVEIHKVTLLVEAGPDDDHPSAWDWEALVGPNTALVNSHYVSYKVEEDEF